MFKFEKNLPKCFLNESRDFQLMSRLDDSVFMGQRADISTITNLNDPKKCKNTFLNLLAEKVGFFTNVYIDDDILRAIIGAFQTCLKYKGTEMSIKLAVTTILKCENTTEEPRIEIVRNSSVDKNKHHLVKIYLPVAIKNKLALKEFLKYILPFGYYYEVILYKSPSNNSMKTNLRYNQEKYVEEKFNKDLSVIVSKSDLQNADKYLVGAVDLGIIADKNDFNQVPKT